MNYIPSQAYNLYPCVMTGRDYNKEQGKYKKLPFIAMAGELSDNCYYRETGMVVNGGYIELRKTNEK